MTPTKIALGRWYDVSLAGNRFPVSGSGPCAAVFDGEDVWVANRKSENVARIRASDGKLLAAFGVAGSPAALAFDGQSIWVATQLGTGTGKAQLLRLRASDGSQTAYALDPTPGAPSFSYTLAPAIAFDGACVWVGMSSPGSGVLLRVRASDGAILPPIEAHGMVNGLAFDGNQIWAANSESINVSRFNAATGAYIGTTAVGVPTSEPTFIAFDGKSIWVATDGGPTLWKLNAQTGAVADQYFASVHAPRGRALAFDGEVLWQATDTGIRQISLTTGNVASEHAIGGLGAGMAFDGANMWVVSASSDTVLKL